MWREAPSVVDSSSASVGLLLDEDGSVSVTVSSVDVSIEIGSSVVVSGSTVVVSTSGSSVSVEVCSLVVSISKYLSRKSVI